MIIIIPGADFSTKHVSQVAVPIQWDVDALAYRNSVPVAAATFDYAKNRALNTFFKALKANGIWGKIDSIYLPLFGYQEGSKNLKNPAIDILNLPAPGDIATYSGKGVLFTGIFAKPGGMIPSAKLLDFHFGFYNTTVDTVADVSQAIGIGLSGATGSGYFLGRRTAANANTTGFIVDSTARVTIPGHHRSAGALIGGINSSLKRLNLQSVAEYGQYTAPEGGSFPSFALPRYAILGSYRYDVFTSPLNVNIGLFTFGSYLSETEMGAYSTLQTNLMNALTANSVL